MAASQTAVEESTVSIALEMSQRIEALAEAGEWDQIEDVLIRLRAAVTAVPSGERRAVVLAAQQSTEKVAAAAKQAHQTVSGKLSDLRRGQVAKKAYELR